MSINQKPKYPTLQTAFVLAQRNTPSITAGTLLQAYVKDEIRSYFTLPQISLTKDPLHWWNQHKHLFPVLSKLARKYLAIPATSASCELIFSDGTNTVTPKRNQLSADMIHHQVFLHENMAYW